MAKSLRYKVEEHLTCSVCLEPFKDPKVLPCLHSYCHGCIVKLTKKSNSTNTINCPECRLVVKVDEKTVSTLPSNFFVNNLLATMRLTSEQPTVKKIVCDSCDSEEAAQSRCNECGIFLCQFCTDFHKRSRTMRHHELMTMDQLKSNPGPQSIAEKLRCPKHKDEVIKLFCKTCQTTICRDCTIVDHQGHKYGFVEEVAVEEKHHLQKNLDEVKQRKARVVQGISDLKNFNKVLEVKKTSTISEISQHFDELAKAVLSQKKKMLEKAVSITNSKQKQIHAQLEVLEMALATCESSIGFTEQAFKNGNDVQILSMEKYILQSLEQLKAVKDQTKPCVTEDLEFIIPSSVQTKEKLLTKYDVCAVVVVTPENCRASFVEEECATIEFGEEKKIRQKYDMKKTPKEKVFDAGKSYSITLICHDQKNRRLRDGGQNIKPSFTGMDVTDVAVTDNKDGSYTITFCPHQSGMLKFEVSINGTLAPNCSLTKQVQWIIDDAYGEGLITNGGRTMNGLGQQNQYCWRVGGCYFDSGVHTWKVQLSFNNTTQSQEVQPVSHLYYQEHIRHDNVEVGVIDYDGINLKGLQNENKCIHRHCVQPRTTDDILFTLDMEQQILAVGVVSSRVNSVQKSRSMRIYHFTARRVSPFFACSSSYTTISLVK